LLIEITGTVPFYAKKHYMTYFYFTTLIVSCPFLVDNLIT